MMCIYAEERISDRTKKIMIFCKRKGKDGTLDQLCISQRFCPQKDRYIEANQSKNCKFCKNK